MALLAHLMVLVSVVAVAAVPLVVVLPTKSCLAPILDLPHAPSASCVSRSAIQLRHAGTGMNRMPRPINATRHLLPPLAATISGTWTPGATIHIIGDLDRLTMHETYHGNDLIHAANGSVMDINRIGTSIIPTTSRPLVLNKVFMFLPHIRTLYPFIILPLIITLLLSFTLFLLDQGSKHEEGPAARQM
jgi:hypothetical protein